MSDPDWLKYEKLVAVIYKTISPNSVVCHNDSIYGVDSGRKRQIDVSIRFSEAGIDFLVVVQVKNYRRKADVEVVDAFATVVKDVRATKGVLVCNAGFSKAAQQLAKSLGIDLLTAHDARSKDWRTTLTIPIVIIKLTPYVTFQTRVYLEEGDTCNLDPQSMSLSADGGNTVLDIVGTFISKWNNREIPNVPDVVHTLLPKVEGLDLLVQNRAGEINWRKVDLFACIYRVNKELYRKDVETSEFTGLRNSLSGNVEIQELGFMLPKLDVSDSSNGWIQLDREAEEKVNTENLFVALSLPVILTGDMLTTDVNIQYQGKAD